MFHLARKKNCYQWQLTRKFIQQVVLVLADHAKFLAAIANVSCSNYKVSKGYKVRKFVWLAATANILAATSHLTIS